MEYRFRSNGSELLKKNSSTEKVYLKNASSTKTAFLACNHKVQNTLQFDAVGVVEDSFYTHFCGLLTGSYTSDIEVSTRLGLEIIKASIE